MMDHLKTGLVTAALLATHTAVVAQNSTPDGMNGEEFIQHANEVYSRHLNCMSDLVLLRKIVKSNPKFVDRLAGVDQRVIDYMIRLAGVGEVVGKNWDAIETELIAQTKVKEDLLVNSVSKDLEAAVVPIANRATDCVKAASI